MEIVPFPQEDSNELRMQNLRRVATSIAAVDRNETGAGSLRTVLCFALEVGSLRHHDLEKRVRVMKGEVLRLSRDLGRTFRCAVDVRLEEPADVSLLHRHCRALQLVDVVIVDLVDPTVLDGSRVSLACLLESHQLLLIRMDRAMRPLDGQRDAVPAAAFVLPTKKLPKGQTAVLLSYTTCIADVSQQFDVQRSYLRALQSQVLRSLRVPLLVSVGPREGSQLGCVSAAADVARLALRSQIDVYALIRALLGVSSDMRNDALKFLNRLSSTNMIRRLVGRLAVMPVAVTRKRSRDDDGKQLGRCIVSNADGTNESGAIDFFEDTVLRTR